MTLQVYNQLTNQIEPFETIEPNVVKLYVCGPTVYADAHIGHALSAIVFDVVRRYLAFRGYRVQHVMNFTDVDDKIINRAKETGEDPLALAQRYIDGWLEHVRELNLLPAHHYPRVSQTMPQILQMIERLQGKEMAYELEGDVFYDVDTFADYGKLSGRKLETAVSGTRVTADSRKDDTADFALWKSAKPGEIAWDSPWGPGRPGWHIECSAMILHYLGEQIDIHGGGNDLIFPHHENEIAQSEAYTGKAPFARYWLHNGMLQLRQEKMSKSLGNLVTIGDFLAEHEADVLRLAILNGHYRKPLSYDDEVVTQAEQALKRLKGGLRPSTGTDTTSEAATSLQALTATTHANFIAAMDDDFNTAGALGHLFSLVKAINTARDAGVGGPIFEQAQTTLRQLAGVLGLTLEGKDEDEGADATPFIQLLVDLRTELRQAKQWALADKIRDQLQQQGIVLEDSPQGTSWYRQ
ncbi:MAG: cysteine--tRNA ligase [Ardenticatenaceae bacterium]|nr:cysteine--tRNA ligase [Ardenticatenaceae bacterium]